jgi:hypothetical protein
MNWESIGAVGELIGAFAVVITLIYLSTQTRENTKAVRHATSRGVLEDANAWRYSIIADAEVSELFRTGLRDPESLSPNDRYRFRLILDALISHWQHAFESDRAIVNSNVPRILSQPGGAWYWSRSTEADGIYTPEFVRFVEETMNSTKQDSGS